MGQPARKRPRAGPRAIIYGFLEIQCFMLYWRDLAKSMPSHKKFGGTTLPIRVAGGTEPFHDSMDFGQNRALMKKIGIVVGLISEARIAQRAGWAVAVGGGLPMGARRMAERLIRDGATALVSFGLAGGLDPSLEAGALVVPRSVLSQHRCFDCDPELRQVLEQEASPVDRLFAGDAVVARAAEKARLWQQHGAAAVDLESGVVAEVAAAQGVPFVVLRAICDPAWRDLPRTAVEALDETGRVRPMKMAGMLARHPLEILGLIALGRDAARARRSLVRGAEGLGRLAPRHPDLG